MDKSQKLKLIESIADKLISKSKHSIKSNLEEFNFEITGWVSMDFIGRKEYVIDKLKAGNIDNILELAKHLEIEIDIRKHEEDSSLWEEGCFKLFISHLDKNKNFAKEIKEGLKGYGISCFVAHDDIRPTSLWQYEIEKALRTCDGLLAILEPGFHQSSWTDQEIGFAFGRGVVIVSVRIGQDPYGFIGKFQAITENQISLLPQKIFDALLNNPLSKEKMGNVLMHLYGIG